MNCVLWLLFFAHTLKSLAKSLIFTSTHRSDSTVFHTLLWNDDYEWGKNISGGPAMLISSSTWVALDDSWFRIVLVCRWLGAAAQFILCETRCFGSCWHSEHHSRSCITAFLFFFKVATICYNVYKKTNKQTKPSLNPSIRTSAHTFIITVRICVCDFTDRNASRTNEDETLVTGTNRILSDSRTEMA